jgi:hypothetical protein
LTLVFLIVLQTILSVISCAEFKSGRMAKMEGGVVRWVGIKCRITRGRSSGEGEIAEVVVYEDAEK